MLGTVKWSFRDVCCGLIQLSNGQRKAAEYRLNCGCGPFVIRVSRIKQGIGIEDGIIESGYLAAHNRKLAYLRVSWAASDFPSVPVVTGGLCIEGKSPSTLQQSILKRWMKRMCLEKCVCVYI